MRSTHIKNTYHKKNKLNNNTLYNILNIKHNILFYLKGIKPLYILN